MEGRVYAVPPGFTGDGLFVDEEALFSEDQAAVVVDSPPPPAAEADARAADAPAR